MHTVCVWAHVRMNAQLLQRCFPLFTLTHPFGISPNPPLLSLGALVSPDPLIPLPLSLWVPSLVRFDFFHHLPNPYFYFSPLSYHHLSQFTAFYSSPAVPSFSFHPLRCFLSFLLSVCCVCVSGCVLARGCQVMFYPIAPSVRSISQGRKLDECSGSAFFSVCLACSRVLCARLRVWVVLPHTSYSQIH